MREHLNRVLLALIAQASTEAGVSMPAEFQPESDAGHDARHEALQCLLLDQHRSAVGTEFSIHETVRTAIEDCERLVPARIEVGTEIYAGVDQVVGDSRVLKELVTLVFAHAQHSLGAQGGRLSFKLDRVEGTLAADECPGLETGPHARLSVQIQPDGNRNGAGVSALDALFQPWPGTGVDSSEREPWTLGLSLARKAAWVLGGRFCNAGVDAAGANLCKVYLPLTAKLQARSLSMGLGSGLGIAVLYVSGEEPILSMGRASLIESDCCVRVACNGQDALRSLAARSNEIDLVVTEEHLDDMSGATLASELRDRHSGLPVLIASQSAGAEPHEELREYIMTPFSGVDLRSAAWMATAPDRRRSVAPA